MNERRDDIPHLAFDISGERIQHAVSEWNTISKLGMPEKVFARMQETDSNFFEWLRSLEPDENIDQQTFVMSAFFARKQLEETVVGIDPLNLERLEKAAEKNFPEAQDLLELAEIYSPNLTVLAHAIADPMEERENHSFVNGFFSCYRIYFLNNQ